MSLGGTTSVQPTYLPGVGGTLILGGTSTVQPTYLYTGSGVLRTGGATGSSITLPYQGSGNLLIAGTSGVLPSYLYGASGLLRVGALPMFLHYPCNDGSGTVLHDTGGGNRNATCSAGFTFTTDVPSVLSGYSLTATYHGAGVFPSVPLDGAVAATVTYWLKVNTNAVDAIPFGVGFQGTGGEGFFGVVGDPTGLTVHLTASDGTTYTAFADQDWSAWHHVAFSFDGYAVRLYFDGLLVATTSVSTPPLVIRANNALSMSEFDGNIDDARFYPLALSDSQIATIANGGELGVSAPAALILPFTGSGTLTLGGTTSTQPTYLPSASGVLTVGGAASVQPTYLYSGSGTLVLGGSASTSQSYAGSGTLTLGGTTSVQPTYLPAAGGLLSLGGSAVIQPTYLYVATGGLVLGGSASVTTGGQTYTGSGGLVLGGSAVVQPTYLYTASGGLVAGGSVSGSFFTSTVAAGGLSLGGTTTVVPTYLYTGAGGLVLGGSASASQSGQSYTGSGSLNLGGAAGVVPTYLYAASGGLVLGGSATVSQSGQSYTGSGALNLGGAAGVQLTYLYTASGGLSVGSTAAANLTLSAAASGLLSTGGSAGVSQKCSYTASGGLTVGGAVGILVNFNYQCSGGLVVGSSGSVLPTYATFASGTLSLAGSAGSQPVFTKAASGGLVTGGAATYSLRAVITPSGKASLGSSSDVVVTYLVTGSGNLSVGGGALTPKNFSYMAGGLLGRLSNFLIEGLDYLKVHPKQRATSSIRCAETLSKETFRSANKNEAVEDLIENSTSWYVICYLGEGKYEIEVDGIRYIADLTKSYVKPKLVPPPVEVHVARHGEPVYEKVILSRDFVLSNIMNQRIKKTLLHTEWVAERLPSNEVQINITSTNTSIVVTLSDVFVEPTVPAPVFDRPDPITDTKPFNPNETTLEAELNKRKNFPRRYAPEYKPEPNVAVVGNGFYREAVTISQDAVLSRSGNFLRNIPKSDWSVVDLDGTVVRVRLKTGLQIEIKLN